MLLTSLLVFNLHFKQRPNLFRSDVVKLPADLSHSESCFHLDI